MSVHTALKKLGKKIIPNAKDTDFDSTSVEGTLNKIADKYTQKVAKDGRGIKTVTGVIDETNKLILTITLTDNSKQIVEGQITLPPA